MSAPQAEYETISRWRSARNKIATAAAMAAVVAAVLWGAGMPRISWFDGASVQHASTQQHAGVTSTDPVPAQQSAAAATKRLQLVATAPGRNIYDGTAQLGADLKNPQTYAAGAWLENGATLREIHSDHVVLERDGQSTELYIEGLARPSGKSVPKTNEALLSLDQSPPPPPPQPTAPPTYTDMLRAAPHFDGDMLVGFDIYPGTGGQFAQLGLQPGDFLTAIDGVPMTTTEALHAALQSVRDGQVVMASVSRKGQSVTVALQSASEQRTEAFARTP
jgi:type II secretory pathway component PulC